MIRKILLVVLVFTCATFVCANSPKSVLELLKNNNSYLQINNNPYLQKRNLENSYAMKNARRDSRFVEFEKTFDVTNMRTRPVYVQGRGVWNCYEIAEDYSIYAVPKVKSLFENVLFRFDWPLEKKGAFRNFLEGKVFLSEDSLSFEKSPIDEIKLYEKIEKSIYRNPSFLKWLLEKGRKRNESSQESVIAKINYEKYIADGKFRMSIDNVWKNTGMSGKYVGTLQIGREGRILGHAGECGVGGWGYSFSSQYDFMMSDNGDVLVSSFNLGEDESFLDAVLDESYFRIKRCEKNMLKKIPSYAKHMYCNCSVASRDYCEKNLSAYKPVDKGFYLVAPKLCNYLVIRRNGKIEYGFNRKTP